VGASRLEEARAGNGAAVGHGGGRAQGWARVAVSGLGMGDSRGRGRGPVRVVVLYQRRLGLGVGVGGRVGSEDAGARAMRLEEVAVSVLKEAGVGCRRQRVAAASGNKWQGMGAGHVMLGHA
jgi:hypothetical protein